MTNDKGEVWKSFIFGFEIVCVILIFLIKLGQHCFSTF